MNDLQQVNSYPEYQSGPYATESSLADLFAIIWRRRWLALVILAATIAASAAVTSVMHKKWRAEVQLVLLERSPEQKEPGSPNYTAPTAETPETQVVMLQSPAMVQRTQDWYANQALQTGQPVPPDVLNSSRLGDDITVLNGKDSNIIYVDVLAPGHDLAINIANAVAAAFVEWKREIAQQDVSETETQLQAELVNAKADMDAALNAEYQYRNLHHIVNVASQENDDLNLYQQDELNLTTVKQDLAAQQSQLNVLGSQLAEINHDFDTGNGIRDEAGLQALQAQLVQAEVARVTEAQKVTPLYPGQLPVMDAQIADLKARIANEIKSTINNGMPSLTNQDTLLMEYKQQQVLVAFDQAKLAAATELANDVQTRLNSEPAYDTTISQLDLQVQSTTQRYTAIEQALDAAKLEFNTTTGNVQIASSAVASKNPASPVWSFNLALGTLVGLLLAIITPLLMEQSKRRVHNIDQIERYRLGAILGVIPKLGRDALVALAEGRSTGLLSDNFSIVRANLIALLARSDISSGHIIMVTSAMKAEGKSVVVAELARTLVDVGKSVIVVDANLRTPTLSKYFSSETDLGLTNVLLDHIPVEDVLISSSPSLSVLLSGPLPDEPARLVSTQPFISLLRSLSQRADIVLVDSPGCEFADPLLLAPHVDYVIQVVASGKASEEAAYGSLSALAGVSHVGVILNYLDAKQIVPHQLVNAAIKADTFGDQDAAPTLTGRIRLAPPDSPYGKKAMRSTQHGEIIPAAKNPGENL